MDSNDSAAVSTWTLGCAYMRAIIESSCATLHALQKGEVVCGGATRLPAALGLRTPFDIRAIYKERDSNHKLRPVVRDPYECPLECRTAPRAARMARTASLEERFLRILRRKLAECLNMP